MTGLGIEEVSLLPWIITWGEGGVRLMVIRDQK
jgi:hypothetical protein